MTTSTIVRFDDDGDLTLIVGPLEQHFLVCSRTLSRTSTVFKAILHCPFMNSHPSSAVGPWVLTLPHDDENGARLVVEIIHANLDNIPTELTLRELYEALIFADKYDMLKVLRPWVKTWITFLSPLEASKDISTALGVASKLGSIKTVVALAERLILRSGVDDKGLLVNSDEELVMRPDTPIIASKLFDYAVEMRQKIIRDIFQKLAAVLQSLQVRIKSGGALFCQHAGSRPDACHAMTLGSIISGLGPMLVEIAWSVGRGDDFDYPHSIQDLTRQIEQIKVVRIYDTHEQCNPIPKLLEDIGNLHPSVESYLTAEELAYLERQEEMLGQVLATGGGQVGNGCPNDNT